MTDQRVLDILNELLAATEKSPHACLAEAGVFFSSTGTQEYEALQRIGEEEQRYTAELADLLLELGGSPALGTPDFQTAHLHFLDLNFVLTEVLRSKERLLAAGESALGQLPGSTPAYQLVCRITAAHREHIALLKRLVARPRPPAVGNQ